MNRRSMIPGPYVIVLLCIATPVLFTGASFATSTIGVASSKQSVGVGQLADIIVKPIDISDWTLNGQILDNDVELKYSGPGNATLGSASGKLDNNGQFSTTFKADKAGEYTITATLGALVQWSNGSADFVFTANSTKVAVTSSGLAIVPKISMSPVLISASPSPTPSSSIGLGITPAINASDLIGSLSNGTPNQTAQPSNGTSGQTTRPGPSSSTPSPGEDMQDSSQTTPVASSDVSAGISSPSPAAASSSTSQQSGGGDTGSTTMYLLIAVVALIAIVGIMGGYILGKGKK